MRRTALGALLWAGALSFSAQAQDQKVVSVQTLSVYDILYVLKGGGANSLALMRDEGVVLVDSKLAGWGKPIMDAVATVSDKPVTTIINTNAEPEHIGGNLEIPTATQIIAHDNTRAAMQRAALFQGPGAKFLPNKTVKDKISLLDGVDKIDLYYFGRGTTAGDLVVVFPQKHVAYLGDMFPSKSAPRIDTEKGGSAVALAETLARAVGEIQGVNRVVTGQDQGSLTAGARRAAGAAIFANPLTMRWADLQEYADFNRDFLTAVKESIAAGKSADQAATTLKLPDRYKNYDMQQAKANVEAIYRELKK